MLACPVTVIIPTMNRIEALRETLDSYMRGCIIPSQIIIVDQTQDTEKRALVHQLINGYDQSIVEYVFLDFPSLTKARNVGFNNAQNDIIIMSDDDVTVGEDTIQNIVEIMQDHSISMIAGINSRDKISKSIISCVFGKKSFRKRKIGHVTSAVVGRFPDRKVEGMVETQWAMGFFFVIRRDLVNRWSLSWDENLFSYAYAEDLDFSYSYYKRASLEQLKCVLSDKVIVEHRASDEWRIPTRKSTFMFVINRMYLSYKHKLGWQSRILVKWLNLGEVLFRMIKRMPVKDLVDAIKVCSIHENEIRKGILKSAWYE